MRESVCVCVSVRVRTSHALLPFPFLPLSLPASLTRLNQLGAEGGTAVAQALCNLPQLQTLDLG